MVNGLIRHPHDVLVLDASEAQSPPRTLAIVKNNHKTQDIQSEICKCRKESVTLPAEGHIEYMSEPNKAFCRNLRQQTP